MKLTKLNERIAPLTGEENPKVTEAMPTYKQTLVLVVGNVASDSPSETEAAYRLLTHIKAADDALSLTDEDGALLIALVGKNPLRMPVAIMGAVLEKLKTAEK
jgi:hypothetical protein